jgi:hypothetical protein
LKINAIKRNYISSLDGLPYLLTLEMVAGLTGFNYETLKKYCQKGTIKARKIGREWRVSQDDFLKMGLGTFDENDVKQ